MINSTISRNLAVAHVGGGLWARGNLYVGNSTITDNYAEGKGGGLLAAGVVTLVNSTVADNIAPVAANVGAGERLEAFGSVIGPAKVDGIGGQAQPTDANCDDADASVARLQRRDRRVVRAQRARATVGGSALGCCAATARSRRCRAARRSTGSRSPPA